MDAIQLRLAPIAPVKIRYQGYTSDVSDDEARRRFQQKYGVSPLEIIRDAITKAGPIPIQEHDHATFDARP